jgi:hypothetical protein
LIVFSCKPQPLRSAAGARAHFEISPQRRREPAHVLIVGGEAPELGRNELARGALVDAGTSACILSKLDLPSKGSPIGAGSRS